MRVLDSVTSLDTHSCICVRELAGGISQRELARRTAEAWGRPDRTDALHQQINRAERSLGARFDPAALEAMVDALDLPVIKASIDLSMPYRWIYRNTLSRSTIDMDGGEPITWVNGRLPVFSDIVNAYEARGWVTDYEGRVVRDLEYSHPREVFHTELQEALGGDPQRQLLDPDCVEFRELAKWGPR